MRNVLISFVGTTKYLEGIYSYGGQQSERMKYVQESIYQLACQHYTADDRMYFLVTEEARKITWETSEKNSPGIKETFIKLAKEAERNNQPFPKVEAISIVSEQDEKGVWSIFNTITNIIEQGDVIQFDITSAFRTMPVIASSVLNYLKFTKQITVANVFYSNYVANEINPIHDISSMLDIFEWTSGVETYIRTGEAALLKETVEKAHITDEDEKVYAALVNSLDELSQVFATCRGNALKDKLIEVHNHLTKAQLLQSDKLMPLQKLLNIIETKINEITIDNDYDMYLDVAEWCIKHNYLQQAATFIRESFTTALCLKLNISSLKYEHRSFVDGLFYRVKHKEKKNFSMELNAIIEAAHQFPSELVVSVYPVFMQIEPILDQFAKKNKRTWDKLTNIRNEMNHASMTNGPSTKTFTSKRTKDIERIMTQNIEILRQFFKQLEDVEIKKEVF